MGRGINIQPAYKWAEISNTRFELVLIATGADWHRNIVQYDWKFTLRSRNGNSDEFTAGVKVVANGVEIYSANSASVPAQTTPTEENIHTGSIELPWVDYGQSGGIYTDSGLEVEFTGALTKLNTKTIVAPFRNTIGIDKEIYDSKNPFFLRSVWEDWPEDGSYPINNVVVTDGTVGTLELTIPYLDTTKTAPRVRMFLYDAESRTPVWESLVEDVALGGRYEVTFALTQEQKSRLHQYIRLVNEEENSQINYYETGMAVELLYGDETSGVVTLYTQDKFNIYVSVTAPTVYGSVTDVNATTVALTGNASHLVRYASNAKAVIEIETSGISDITEYSITNGARRAVNQLTYTFEQVESGKFEFQATNNFNESGYDEVNAPVFIPYIKPTSKIHTGVISADGDTNVKITGAYYNGSFGAQENSIAVYYRYKKQYEDEFSDWIMLSEVAVDATAQTYVATGLCTGIDYTKVYIFQARVVDKIYDVISPDRTAVSRTVFDWSNQDFNFNVPVTIEGVPVMTVGDKPVNKILWNGTDVMASGTTIELSEAISAQEAGVIFVFTMGGLQGGADDIFNYTFVPKIMVTLGGSNKHIFNVSNGQDTTAGKVLTITDTSVSGHIINSKNNSNYFTLRYVIGV